MKIGIVTWYGVTNYGSALQAYALQRLISQAGYESRILRHPVHEKVTSNQTTRRSGASIDLRELMRWSPRRVAVRRGERGKADAIARFRTEHLKISDAYIQDSEVDLAIVGSDQIFDFLDYHGSASYHSFQFGHTVNAKTISAYAPSFGQMTRETFNVSPHRAEAETGIRAMTYLSARDNNTRDILEEIAGREVPVVLDPTLAYSFSMEETWITPPPFDRYLVVYAWGPNTGGADFAKAVTRFARAHNMKTVSVGDRRPWCDLNVYAASPPAFFSLIAQAATVVTNMFHGACFSLLKSVPVIPLVEPRNANKMSGLLRQLDIGAHQVDEVSEIGTSGVPDIDYVRLARKLEVERIASQEFLHKVLSGVS